MRWQYDETYDKFIANSRIPKAKEKGLSTKYKVKVKLASYLTIRSKARFFFFFL